MKRKVSSIIVTGILLAIGLVTAPRAWSESVTCRNVPSDCKDAKPLPCDLTVLLEPTEGGGCRVTKIEPPQGTLERHHIRVCNRKDTITWTFESNCPDLSAVEIDHFHLDQAIIDKQKANPKIETEERDPQPLDGLSKAPVAKGKKGTVTGKPNTLLHQNRTYKYEIIGHTSKGPVVLLDPEIEIYDN
jgi:hypothetical protein